MFSAYSPISLPIQSASFTQISQWRASSQHWRAMSSLSANGAVSVPPSSATPKSQHVRAGAFEGLDLADEDAVHQPAGGVGGVRGAQD